MKQYMRLIILFIVAVVILLLFNVFRQASAPESEIIARAKDKMEASFDKGRAAKDVGYAMDHQNKVEFLDYQIAQALIRENKPDPAVSLLQKLIATEENRGKDGKRRSGSYLNEARYYEALQAAYGLKHDEAGAERAADRRKQAMAGAEQAKSRERLEEGRSVGLKGE